MKDNTSQPFDIADIFALLERDGDGKLSHEEVRLVGCCAMGGFPAAAGTLTHILGYVNWVDCVRVVLGVTVPQHL